MAVSNQTRRTFALATGLRGLLMLLGGLYAVIFPLQALTVIVLAGGILLLIDGVLGLWSITFGGEKTGNFWFDVVRNVLAIATGVIILISPMLAAILTATFVSYIVALQCLFVGGMEIYVVLKERDSYARIWPVLLSGVSYVLFGLALIIAPILTGVILVVMGGALMILFSIGLFGLAWRMYQASKGAPAA